MNNKIIIAIGGTGIKCLESFVHYCSVCRNEATYEVLIIEPDKENGNLSRLQNTIKNYNQTQDILYPRGVEAENTIYGFSAKFIIDKTSSGFNVWSPPEAIYSSKRNEKKSRKIEDLKDYKKSKFVDALYLNEEITADLNIGFRGHPSIGALINGISMSMNEDKVWNNFISKIPVDSKIMVFGSLFGGTGAAGIYSVVKKILDYEDTSGEKTKPYLTRIADNKLKICIGMATPYYKLPENPNKNSDLKEISAENDSLIDNTKFALKFYSEYAEGFLDNVSLLVVGKNDKDYMSYRDFSTGKWVSKTPEFNEGGEFQKNPSNITELVMASCAKEFFEENNLIFQNGKTYIPLRSKSENEKDFPQEIDWTALKFTEENFPKNFRTSLFVALCYSYKLHPIFKSIAASNISNNIYSKYSWLKYFEYDFNTDLVKTKTSAEFPLIYYKYFIDWVHSICNITLENSSNNKNKKQKKYGQLVNIGELESMIINKNYSDNFDYSKLIYKHDNANLKWNKGFHKVENRLNDGANSDPGKPSFGLSRLLFKLYSVGGIE